VTPPPPQRTWDDVVEGEALPPFVDRITLERVVASAAATAVYFGGHIDPDYARTVQGRRHVYLATGPILGLLDRHVTSWAGPEAFLVKRSMRMAESICAGDEIRFEGTVARKACEEREGRTRWVVELELGIFGFDGRRCVTAKATWELPRRG
jgi:acyl dehydratase